MAPPPHKVEEVNLPALPPNKLEEKKISEQNYLIFAEFRAATFAIFSTSWGGLGCFTVNITAYVVGKENISAKLLNYC